MFSGFLIVWGRFSWMWCQLRQKKPLSLPYTPLLPSSSIYFKIYIVLSDVSEDRERIIGS
jgi:hypothetical protein